jgi:hypothetical protein
MPLSTLCLAVHRSTSNAGCVNGDRTMPSYDPELIQTMRAVLDEAVTKIPVDQVTPGIKAQMAEFILRAAAEGRTGYEELLAAALAQIQPVLSMLT